MESKTTPACTRLVRVLEKLGHTSSRPFLPAVPVRMTLTIDLPGVLDFDEPVARAFWVEDGILRFASEDGYEYEAVNRFEDYGDGFYADEYWSEETADELADALERTAGQA